MTNKSKLGEWIDKNFVKNTFFNNNPLYINFQNLEFSKWNGIDYKSGGYVSKSKFLGSYLENEREKGNRKQFAGFRKVINKKHFDENGNPKGFKLKILENGKGIPVDNKGNDISHLLDWDLEEVYKDKSSITPIITGIAAIAAYGAIRGTMHKRKQNRS